jgi:hypothetical protein
MILLDESVTRYSLDEHNAESCRRARECKLKGLGVVNTMCRRKRGEDTEGKDNNLKLMYKNVMINEKFWEGVISYFSLIRHGPHRKRRLQQFFVAAGTSLISCYPVTIGVYTDSPFLRHGPHRE